MNKERRQVQLWALSLQQRIPVQDAEGVLVLVDRVGVRDGAFFALSGEAGPVAVLVLHHQVRIALSHDAAARQVLCAQKVNVRNQPKLKEQINYISTESDFAGLCFVVSLLKTLGSKAAFQQVVHCTECSAHHLLWTALPPRTAPQTVSCSSHHLRNPPDETKTTK